MQVTINVSERDAKRIIQLGTKPWGQITEKEKEEYAHLLGLVGSAACMKILNK